MSKEWLPLIFAAGVLAGCGGGSNNSDTGTLKLAVVDAPIDDAKEVVVTFTGVELLDEGGSVRETIMLDEPTEVNLLEHQGQNNFFLIDGQPITAGIYDSVRLLTAQKNASCSKANLSSYVRTLDGEKHPLLVPSGELKVKGPLTIAAGNTGDYTVDFVLRKALAERGSTGCYNIKPTALRVVDNAKVGNLFGVVDAALLNPEACPNLGPAPAAGEALPGAAVYVYQGAGVSPDDVGSAVEPLTTGALVARPDGDYDYAVGFLLTGPYTVALTCDVAADAPETDDNIGFLGLPAAADITTGNDTEVNFTAAP